jgi:hypothetical protein
MDNNFYNKALEIDRFYNSTSFPTEAILHCWSKNWNEHYNDLKKDSEKLFELSQQPYDIRLSWKKSQEEDKLNHCPFRRFEEAQTEIEEAKSEMSSIFYLAGIRKHNYYCKSQEIVDLKKIIKLKEEELKKKDEHINTLLDLFKQSKINCQL